MSDSAPNDEIGELVQLSLDRGRRRGEYRPPVHDPLATPMPAPELHPGLAGLLADIGEALVHLARKGFLR